MTLLDITLLRARFDRSENPRNSKAMKMIDVSNPFQLTNPPTANDVLLSTHTHSDHYVESFAQAFPGETMLLTAGELELQDVSIKAILSSGAWYDGQVPDSNTIYVVDVGGLRVAHFGDIAQQEFAPEQLEALQNLVLSACVRCGNKSADLILVV